MSTIFESPPTVTGRKRKAGAIWWVLATALALAAGFWAGHHWWPGPGDGALPSRQAPSALTTPTAAPLLAGVHGIPIGETTIADIAADGGKSVVNIDTRTSVPMPDSPFQFGGPLGGFEFFFGPEMQPFEERPRQRRFESQGTGSGEIVRPDGYILTNNHVVRNATDIKVTLADKQVFKGRIVGRDSFTDLALIKIDADNLPVGRFGSSKTLRPGEWAIAIGSPLGLDHTVTLGIISALGRSVGDLRSNVELIQTDAAINPGNSGGPLLNIKGEVIGINTAIRSDAQNIGFAIPVDVARDVVDGLLSRGSVARPYVGVYMQDLDPKLAKSLGLAGNSKGVIVARVAPGSPAEKAGLSQGDVIQRIDGQPVVAAKEVQKLVRTHRPGDTLNMLVSHNGTLTAATIKITDYPSEDKQEE